MSDEQWSEEYITTLRRRLEAAGRRWHSAMRHKGTYRECQEMTCYHTHRKVSR